MLRPMELNDPEMRENNVRSPPEASCFIYKSDVALEKARTELPVQSIILPRGRNINCEVRGPPSK